jgi:Trypsin-like peptidase domain
VSFRPTESNGVRNLTSPFRALSAALLLTSLCFATNVKDHLVAVQRSTFHFVLPPTVRQIQGNGICVNTNCSIVATAYHVQRLVGRANLGVANGSTEKVLSLANESDTDKSDVSVGKKTFSYNLGNDVSFIYTRKPVPHKSGIPYSYTLHVGQKVNVAGYHNHELETREAHIIGVNVHLVIGQAQLKEDLVLDISLSPGTSGSAVLDEQGNLLGMVILSGVLNVSTGKLIVSIGLPVRTIAKALVKLDPALGDSIFTNIPEEGPEIGHAFEALYQESDVPEDKSPVIPRLSAAPGEVANSIGRLHANSRAASARMVNFVTKQCLVQGTQKSLCHELSIIDGRQTFREMDKSGNLGKPTAFFPVQKYGVWTESDWTDTLGEIADNPWIFQGSVDGHYLFTFRSVPEDDRCYWEEYPKRTSLFGVGHQVWKGPVACFEQILTDKDFNVLSVFTELRPPDGCLTELVQVAIYYDWISLGGLKSPVLLPVVERITAKVLGQKDLWYASVFWTDYKEFRADHKVTY